MQYKIAIICRNGHIIDRVSETGYIRKGSKCIQCEAEVISKCESCGEPIRGDSYCDDPQIFIPKRKKYKPSPVCKKCKKPYPWTVNHIERADAILKADSRLSTEDKVTFSKCMTQLICGEDCYMSMTKKYIGKVDISTKDCLRELITEINTEAVPKLF